MIADALFICIVSVCTSISTDLFSWYFTHSKPAFQKLKDQIEKSNLLIKKLKDEGREEKKRLKLEKDVKKDSATLAGMRMYSMIILTVSMIVVYQLLRSQYDGAVVAKLPFEPFPLLARITHAGLKTEDMTDCGMTFVYALSTLAVRPNMQKIFGDGMPKGSSSLFDQIAELEKSMDK
eukprot:gene5074-10153_t